MTIIEAVIFVLFTFLLVYLWFLILGLGTMISQQEERFKEFEKKIQDKFKI